MNPENQTDLTRLYGAIRSSIDDLEPFRRGRLDLLEQYAGQYYGDSKLGDVPLNLIELATSIFMYQLAASAPQVLISTPHRVLKLAGELLELATNKLLNIIDAEQAFQEVVFNALNSIGIMKVGLEQGPVSGELRMLGQVFMDPIDLDDWVHDMRARRWSEIGFAGHRMRLPYDDVMGSSLYDPRALRDLEPTDRTHDDHLEGERQASDLSQSSRFGEDDDFIEYVDIYEIWLPRQGLIVTMPIQKSERPLRVVQWSGPSHGPYHYLSFANLPNNTMPVAPGSHWRVLHETANILFNKIIRQAERQKDVIGYSGDAQQDAERIRDAADGEMVRMDHPDSVRAFKFGGPDSVNLALTLQIRDIANWAWGNLDSLGGLAPQSGTAAQDELLSAGASKRVAHMQNCVRRFAKHVVRDLAWYLFTDPLIEMPLTYRLPGTDLTAPVSFRAEDRRGEFLDYNFDIQPFSMSQQTPSGKMAVITQILERIILPLAGPMQQQGQILNTAALLKILSKLSNTPEISDLVKSVLPSGTEIPPTGTPPPKSPFTRREYVRRNVPGATRSGKDDVLSRILMGAGVQQSEAASLGTPTG